MKLICISGKAGHGKDFAGGLIKKDLESRGERVVISHYADLVKYVAKSFFDWNGEKNEHGRTLLQKIGTDIVRRKQPNYWVEFIVSVIQLFGDEDLWDYMIVPDCRFPNEVDIPRQYGIDTTVVRVERPGYVGSLTDEQKKHPSEVAMDDYERFDFFITNNGDFSFVDEIEWLVDSIMEEKEDHYDEA